MDVADRLINSPPDLGPKRPKLRNLNPLVQLSSKGGVCGRPQLADAFSRGRGVNGNDSAGTCAARRAWIEDWMQRLSDRLRPVRVCCGDWDRVCDSYSTTIRLGTTGVFLDPPYRKRLHNGKRNRHHHIYANDRNQCVDSLCDEAEAWCLKWGDNPGMRIALCGLEGEYPAVEAAGWDVFAWESPGGYGNQSGDKNENAKRERVYFSPHCLPSWPREIQAEFFDESVFACQPSPDTQQLDGVE